MQLLPSLSLRIGFTFKVLLAADNLGCGPGVLHFTLNALILQYTVLCLKALLAHAVPHRSGIVAIMSELFFFNYQKLRIVEKFK